VEVDETFDAPSGATTLRWRSPGAEVFTVGKPRWEKSARKQLYTVVGRKP